MAAAGSGGPSGISRRIALIAAWCELPAYAVVGGGLTTIGSVLLAGAPTGAIGDWAQRRLLDTIAGCAIALVFTYLLWPRDRESEETAAVPAPEQLKLSRAGGW